MRVNDTLIKRSFLLAVLMRPWGDGTDLYPPLTPPTMLDSMAPAFICDQVTR